jgi:hypothetical protein
MSVLHRVLSFARGFDTDDFLTQCRQFGAAVADQLDITNRRLTQIQCAVARIEKQLCNLPEPEPAKAICDNCKIDVILSARHADRASDYVQNLGWSIRGEQTLCPGCTKVREAEEEE